MKLKRIIMILVILIMLPLTTAAKQKPLSGDGGIDSVWTYDPATKTMTFSGTGVAANWSNRCWAEEVEHVVLEEGMTIVGEKAFESYNQLKDIKLPSTLKIIEVSAFESCYNLHYIELNEGLEIIKDSAFMESNINSIVIPSSVKEIGNSAFSCSYLESITLNEGLEKIGRHAFESTRLAEIKIPDSVVSLGDCNFIGCYKLKKVVLPNGLNELDRIMFWDCKKLRHIELPESLIKIKADTFKGTALQTLTIPSNVQQLGSKREYDFIKEGMFKGCKKLKKVNITTRKLKKVYKETFINTPNKVVLIVPKGLKKKYSKMFYAGGLSKKVKIKESGKW